MIIYEKNKQVNFIRRGRKKITYITPKAVYRKKTVFESRTRRKLYPVKKNLLSGSRKENKEKGTSFLTIPLGLFEPLRFSPHPFAVLNQPIYN